MLICIKCILQKDYSIQSCENIRNAKKYIKTNKVSLSIYYLNNLNISLMSPKSVKLWKVREMKNR